jgi:hypothetical protein
MREDTVWDEAWDEEFKKCATRALFQPTPTLTQAYCRVLHGQPARGVGIHVRTGMFCMRRLLSCLWGDEAGGGGMGGVRAEAGVVSPGDDRTWNADHANPVDEHFRYKRRYTLIFMIMQLSPSGIMEAAVYTNTPLSPPRINHQFSEHFDLHTPHVSRFARCADGIRTAVLAANASGALTLPDPRGPQSPLGRQLDVNRWHVASDYQKVVDDVAQVSHTCIRIYYNQIYEPIE